MVQPLLAQRSRIGRDAFRHRAVRGVGSGGESLSAAQSQALRGEGSILGKASSRIVEAGIALVPEGRHVFPFLTARENLQFFAAMNNLFDAEAAARLDELTDLMGMGTFIDSQVRTLSTGQVHRLGLARAMIHRPSVLLLDEPTEGVWIGVIEEITERLILLAKEIAVVIVEQHLDLALRVADYAYVLDRGRVALQGAAGEVRSDPELLRYLAP